MDTIKNRIAPYLLPFALGLVIAGAVMLLSAQDKGGPDVGKGIVIGLGVFVASFWLEQYRRS